MKTQFRYLEDYQVGQKGVTLTRTVTEADIVNFAYIAAEFSRDHVDRQYMLKSVFGERIAQGILGASLLVGMLSLTAPHTIGRGVPGAYLWSFDVNFRGAIKMGDTIKIRWTIAEKADDPAHKGFGLVKTNVEAVNQDEVSVYNGVLSILVRKKSAGDAKLKLEPGKPWDVNEFVYDREKVYYLEDLPVDSGSETEGRTITEADIVNFAGLTGDYDPKFVDAEYARNGQFGERIAPGMLIFAFANGYRGNDTDRYKMPEGGAAGHSGDKIVFLAPVKIGDTIRCRHKIAASRVSKSRPEMGIITYGVQVINQRDEVVLEGYLVNLRPTRAVSGR